MLSRYNVKFIFTDSNTFKIKVFCCFFGAFLLQTNVLLVTSCLFFKAFDEFDAGAACAKNGSH